MVRKRRSPRRWGPPGRCFLRFSLNPGSGSSVKKWFQVTFEISLPASRHARLERGNHTRQDALPFALPLQALSASRLHRATAAPARPCDLDWILALDFRSATPTGPLPDPPLRHQCSRPARLRLPDFGASRPVRSTLLPRPLARWAGAFGGLNPLPDAAKAIPGSLSTAGTPLRGYPLGIKCTLRCGPPGSRPSDSPDLPSLPQVWLARNRL